MILQSLIGSMCLFLTCIVANAQPILPGSSGTTALLNGPNASGRSYFGNSNTTPSNQALGAANRLFATPLQVGAGSTLKSLSFDIGTGNAAAWNARMCVYADNGTGAPGALIANGDTGTIAIGSGSVTGVQTATLNGSSGIPVAGWIWLAFMADSSSESLLSWAAGFGVSALQTNLLGASSATNIFTGNATSGVFMAQTFGACPSNFGAVSYSNIAPTPMIVANF